jgi:hypothetical protein
VNTGSTLLPPSATLLLLCFVLWRPFARQALATGAAPLSLCQILFLDEDVPKHKMGHVALLDRPLMPYFHVVVLDMHGSAARDRRRQRSGMCVLRCLLVMPSAGHGMRTRTSRENGRRELLLLARTRAPLPGSPPGRKVEN